MNMSRLTYQYEYEIVERLKCIKIITTSERFNTICKSVRVAKILWNCLGAEENVVESTSTKRPCSSFSGLVA